MMVKLWDRRNLLFFGMLILFGILVYSWRGQIETITPGQELRAECVVDDNCAPDEVCEMGMCKSIYPVDGLCDGRAVTIYGRPSFHNDPVMQHMYGMPCSNPDQCIKWPPESAVGPVECCMNQGVCVVYK